MLDKGKCYTPNQRAHQSRNLCVCISTHLNLSFCVKLINTTRRAAVVDYDFCLLARQDEGAECKLKLRYTQSRSRHTHTSLFSGHTQLKYLACFLWIDATVCIFFTVNGHSAVHIYGGELFG